MAVHLMYQVKQAALRAFLRGQSDVFAAGIMLHIRRVLDDDHQVLLPNGSELFRIVGQGVNARVLAL